MTTKQYSALKARVAAWTVEAIPTQTGFAYRATSPAGESVEPVQYRPTTPVVWSTAADAVAFGRNHVWAVEYDR